MPDRSRKSSAKASRTSAYAIEVGLMAALVALAALSAVAITGVTQTNPQPSITS
jgi:hypothetical protein